jgi:plastocyanin
MKKNHIIIILMISVLMFSAIPGSFAVVHIIHVGNFYFNPSSISNVNTGDTVRWVWDNGSHTTTSTSVPAGASSWDTPLNSSNTSFEYYPVVAGTYNYKCTPHFAMGMTGSFTVVAVVPLSVSATADPSSLCSGSVTQLHAFASGGNGSYVFSWTSNPPGFTSNQQNPVATPLQNTTYTVSVTSGGQSDNASVAVTVTSPPVANAGHDTSYCVTVTEFTVEGNATGYSSVGWNSAGDGAFTDGTTLTAIYSPGPVDISTGYVNLVLTAHAIAPCAIAAIDTVHIIFDPCLGINNQGNPQFSLSVFPNPSEGRFMLNATGIRAGQVQVRITAMDGRTVYSETLNSTGNDLQKRIDLGGYPSGIYFVSVTSDNKISAQRFILQK